MPTPSSRGCCWTRRGWRPWLDLDDAPGLWAESWTRLLDAVRTGSPGRDEDSYYAELERTGRWASFNALMEAQVRANAEQVASVYDWSSVAHVVDVGGGTGVLLRALLDAHPHLRATLFDLPQVVEGVEPTDRLEIVAGDVFHDPIPAADVYVLSRIVHGWPDEGAAQILQRCAEAGGDTRSDPARRGSHRGAADRGRGELRPLHARRQRRRERTLEEFRRLAEGAGLEVRSSQLLSSGNSLVELGR